MRPLFLFSVALLLQLNVAPVLAADVLSSHLKNLQGEFQSYITSNQGTIFVSQDTAVNVVQNRNVVVDISVLEQSQVQPLIDKLHALGATHTSSYKKQISTVIAINQLSALENFPEISWAQSSKATRRAVGPPGGSVFNAADPAMFTDVVRRQYNVDGSSVTIGVLSDSYNCLEGAELGVATGDLPEDVSVLKEYPFCENGASDEGRAMMELIHDIAPGAKQIFYTAFVSATDFAAGIQALADAGADVIVDDVGYFAMPMFQDGPIAQSVNEVKQRGISYFSAAGNAARLSYENDYFAGIDLVSRDNAHDFGKAAGGDSDFYQKITLPANQLFVLTLQWDDPAEVAGGKGAESDLDIFLLDEFKRQIITSSQDNNIAHNPVEIIGGIHSFDSTTFYLRISHRAGPAPSRIKYIINGPVAPWPDFDPDQILELNVLIENETPTLVFPDGMPITGGIAAVVMEYFVNFQRIREIRILSDNDLPLLVGAGGKPVVLFRDLIRDIGPGTGIPIFFIPDGFSFALNPNGEIELFRERDDFVPVSIDQYATYSSTIFGHPNASGAMAVAAMPYQETPWFGSFSKTSRIESFSSAGGTAIYFDDNGNRLAQKSDRFKPEIVAPDATDTTFFGVDTDGNGLPNFTGTSAAAPHAAALAVLLKQAFPHLTPDGISLAMTKGSLDLEDPARVSEFAPINSACATNTIFDFATGCGLVQADLVFAQVSEISDNVFLTLETSSNFISADVVFEYHFKLVNFSESDLQNVRIRAIELPKFVVFLDIQGCIAIDNQELSCRLETVPAGETREVTIRVMPGSNPEGQLIFQADLLTPTLIDLTNTKVNLRTRLASIKGDFNFDACVDISDWAFLFAAMRAGGSFDNTLDLTGDGLIGLDDLSTLENLYSRPPLGDPCNL